jgi:cation diffusion facilitator CzcD-associated flavoprotein CzcO
LSDTFPGAPYPYWSRWQAPGSDCAKYALFLAKRYHARDYIRFDVEIQSANWDDPSGKWHVQCKDLKTGEEWTDKAEVLINSTGLLSQPRYPKLEGIEEYNGLVLHTAQWRSESDFKDKKVALVGLGSSAIQTLPTLQAVGKSVDQYCKSTSWIVPLFSGTSLTAVSGQR